MIPEQERQHRFRVAQAALWAASEIGRRQWNASEICDAASVFVDWINYIVDGGRFGAVPE